MVDRIHRLSRWVHSILAIALMGATATIRPAASPVTSDVGVLVLAHGGSSRWNHTVEQAVQTAHLPYPTATAFGMAMEPDEVQRIQRAVDRLQQQGVHRLIVVPLLVSSFSEVMRQFQYVLGLAPRGPWQEHIQPVRLQVPVVMTLPLDDDPVVSEILLERALALSQAPTQENVVLVAHGPVSDEDNTQWLAVMNRLAQRVQHAGHFRAVVAATLRDDAPDSVQAQAARELRELVQAQSQQGRTLVIPLLLAQGGIEQKIPKYLNHVAYVYTGEPLLPHPKLSQWIEAQVAQAVSRVDSQLAASSGVEKIR